MSTKPVKLPQRVFWGGYSGYVADPDGHAWEIAWNPAWTGWATEGRVIWGPTVPRSLGALRAEMIEHGTWPSPEVHTATGTRRDTNTARALVSAAEASMTVEQGERNQFVFDYARLRRVARALHVEWPDAMGYPELVRTLDPALPAHAAFIDQALSLFRGAGYLAFGVGGVPVPVDDDEADTSEAVHAAIASRYAHVTAPLRRLVDRYGEEVCVAACAGASVPSWVLQALPGLPEVMATTGQRARAIGRGAVAALEALVLRGHEGDVFDGVITSAKEGKDGAPQRGEVMLSEPAVVGALTAQASELPVGERVRVRLDDVDVASGRIDFALVTD